MTNASDKLHRKTIHGATWRTTSMVVAELLLMVRTIVIARLIGPHNMGLFGMAMLSLTTAELLSKTGFSQAIIQYPKDVSEFLGTHWVVQIVRGIMLSAVLFLISEWLGGFFNEPTVVLPLQILSVVPFIRGLESAGFVMLQRNMDFKGQFYVEAASAIAGLLVSIGFALYSPTVWALVCGSIASVVVMVIASYVVAKPWVFGPFRWKQFVQLRQFGMWVFVSSIVAFALTKGGDFVVGKMLAASALGVYQVSLSFSNKPVLKIAAVITSVTLPAFSTIQTDLTRLRKAFLETFSVVTALVFLAGLMVFVLSTEFVEITLGPKWANAASVMKWLSIWGICRGLGAANSSFFMAVGKPHLVSVFQILMLFIVAVMIYPMITRYELDGVGISLAVAGVSGQTLRYILLNRILKARFLDVYLPVIHPSLAFAVAAGAFYGIQTPIRNLPALVRLIINGMSALVLYAGFLACFLKMKNYLLFESLMKILGVLFQKK